MKLKKIELQGFKSFAGKTEFSFGEGITGIVGPNGCGKSNVVDCINWVLGTLSHKLIRGDEMQDVIFKGTETLPPTAFASVSLTLDNSDHVLRVPYEEVTITRKIYRSGEGEYFINKAPCRLKDIREMLMDTGLGVDSFTVIEQGRINDLILKGPRDRRAQFDDVAGISKYKAKRREAQQRLEKVNADLQRIEEHLAQVESELHSVRIQAGRARKYQELLDEFRTKRKILYLQEYRILVDRARALQELRARLEEERRELDSRRQGAQQELADREAAIQDRAEELHGFYEQVAELGARRERLRAEIQRCEERLREFETLRREKEAEAAALRRKAESLHLARKQLEESLRASEERLAALERSRRDLPLQQESARKEIARVEQEIEEKKSQVMDLSRRASDYRNEMTEIDTALRAVRENIERLGRELAQRENELSNLQVQRETLEREREEKAKIVQEGLARNRESEERLRGLRANLAEIEGRIDQRQKEIHARRAKLETLQDLESRRAGLEAGARALLDARAPGVRGLAADLVDVDPGYVTAADAVLQDLQGYLVFEGIDPAIEAAGRVRENAWGDVGMIFRHPAANEGAEARMPSGPGVLGSLADHVRFQDECLEAALMPLLRRTILVDTLRAGMDRLAEFPGYVFVTRDGTVLRGGVLSLRKPGSYEKSFLSRRSAIGNLQEEIARADAELKDLTVAREETRRDIDRTEEELKQLRHTIYEMQAYLTESAKAFESLEARERTLAKEIETVRLDLKAQNAEAAAKKDRRAKIEELLQELGGLDVRLRQELAEMEQTLKDNRNTLERFLQKKTEIERAHAEESARRDRDREALSRAQRERFETEALIEKNGAIVRESEEKIRQVGAEAERLRRESAAAEEEQARLDQRRVEVQAAEGALQEALEQGKQAIRELDEAAKRMAEEERKHELEEQEIRLKREGLEQRAREEIEVSLEEALKTEPAAGAPPENRPLSEEETAQLTQDVKRLQQRISSFGSVNMLALQELKDKEDRQAFLNNSRNDLRESREKLEQFIARLNQECHEKFSATIEKVRGHFGEIFRKIFNGGKADISVENEPGVDPLEQGVEVSARLPGKEITKLSLMSGGERSLTAIALTLAMFRVRPTAFCVLDEVDAPLDEKNCARFAALLKEFSRETQFIVITHNKRTMAACDRLYGVTMQTPGVSLLVSVNLQNLPESAEAPAQ